jgi:hypothetical protein
MIVRQLVSFSLRAAALTAVLLASAHVANAATIIKLSLGDTGPDIEYSGGTLSTFDDGDNTTLGDQNTDITFLDFLSDIANIDTPIASYSLSNVLATGPAVLFGGITQQFNGGEFQLYDDSDNLLLDVDLGASVLNVNPAGGTGSVFSITSGNIVGGSLQSRIIDDTIEFSIGLAGITPTAGPLFVPGISIPPVTLGTLGNFQADASQLIAGEIPEPTSAVMVALAGLFALPVLRRHR